MTFAAHLKKAVLLALSGLYCTFSWPTALAVGERNYGPITACDFKTFRVRMQTDVVIPALDPAGNTGGGASKRCILLRTWHAQPSYKPWSATRSPLGAIEYSASPTAKIETEEDNRSTHIYWEERKKLSPGQRLSFVSYFKVISPKRSFNPSTQRITWSDVDLDNRTNSQRMEEKDRIESKNIPAEILNLTKTLRSNHDPANAVKAYCQWIHDNIRYDASVGYQGDDVNAILSGKRGHCGHMITVLRHMCAATGLKIRVITGLNLSHPDGRPSPGSPNPQPNAHLWAEIFFPRIGWIEVEPLNGEKCFEIPAGFIENNSAFQNYAVWYTESDNVPRQAMTSFLNGKYRADYDLVHTITFSQD